MQDWRKDWRTDSGLRLGGVALCALAYLAIRSLLALHLSQARVEPGASAFALAAAAFLCASIGAALMIAGRHVLDEIEVSQRWRIRTDVNQGDDALD